MRPTRLVIVLALVACAKPDYGLRAGAPSFAAVPAGVTHATETFTGVHGTKLFAQSWRPAEGEPRGVVVVQHGLRDHGDRYGGFASRLAARGYAVYAYDLRGHGRSAGPRVTVAAFDDYVTDLDTYIASIRAREGAKPPLFVFGHSMGGAIVILWAERHRDALAGLITSAPAIRIDLPPFMAAATLLAGTLTPNLGQLAPDNSKFSSDPAVEADMGRDPLIYQPPGPVATAAQLVGGIERVWAGVDRLTVPLLLLHGRADQLTAPAGSRDLYQRAPSTDKTLRLYEGHAHDLVHEPGDQVTPDVIAWLDAHTGGAPATFDPPDLQRGLRGDARKPSASIAIEAGYERTRETPVAQEAGAALRTRFLLGGAIAWPLGLDADVFGGTQLMYRAVAYPIGLGWHGGGQTISVGAGAGLSSIGHGASFEAPLAVDAEAQLGPIRLLAWARVSWIFSEARRRGAWAGADEMHFGLAVRLGANHRYWATTNAGTGPYLGVTLDRVADTSIYGVVLGLHLWGGN